MLGFWQDASFLIRSLMLQLDSQRSQLQFWLGYAWRVFEFLALPRYLILSKIRSNQQLLLCSGYARLAEL